MGKPSRSVFQRRHALKQWAGSGKETRKEAIKDATPPAVSVEAPCGRGADLHIGTNGCQSKSAYTGAWSDEIKPSFL